MIGALRRFLSVWPNVLGVLIIGMFAAIALLAPWIAPLRPAPRTDSLTLEQLYDKTQKDRVPQPPSAEHPLGTLKLQIDIWQSLVWGTRQIFAFSIKTALASALLGVVLGATSASLGGWFNSLVLRVADGFLSVPVIVVLVMLNQAISVAMAPILRQAASLGQTGLMKALAPFYAIDPTFIAIVLVSWVPYTRILNAMITRVKSADFVQASHALGASTPRLILRHLLPNSIAPIFVLLARDLGWFVILQASINYAGLGGSPSVWGRLLMDGRDSILGPGGNPFGYWWVWVPGTLAFILYGIGWNLIGDGLNDQLNLSHR